MPGCYSCNTIGSICRRCHSGLKLYKKKECIATSNTVTRKFPHCLIWNATHCLKCESGYTNQKKERLGKCFPFPQNNEYYYDNNEKVYIKCLDSSYLERCLRCTDAQTCIECDTKAHVLKNGKCIRISN